MNYTELKIHPVSFICDEDLKNLIYCNNFFFSQAARSTLKIFAPPLRVQKLSLCARFSTKGPSCFLDVTFIVLSTKAFLKNLRSMLRYVVLHGIDFWGFFSPLLFTFLYEMWSKRYQASVDFLTSHTWDLKFALSAWKRRGVRPQAVVQ